MKILAIVAGTNEPSNSAVLADAFLRGAGEIEGAQTEVIRLKDLRIDHFTLEFYTKACRTNDDFCALQEKVEEADGIVIATPIWNFSVPAHLKNVIDRMGAFALDEETHTKGQLGQKPFYFIYTGGAPMIAWKALMNITMLHVSEAVKYYGGAVIGRHFEPKAMPGRGIFGLVVDKRPDALSRVRWKGKRFARLVDSFARTGKLPLWKRIHLSFYTWATRIANRITYPLSMQQ